MPSTSLPLLVLLLVAGLLVMLLRRERRARAAADRLLAAQDAEWRAILHATEHRHRQTLSSLSELFALRGTGDSQKLLAAFSESLLRGITSGTGARQTILLKLDTETNRFRCLRADGLSPEAIARCEGELGEGVVGKAGAATALTRLDRDKTSERPWSGPSLLFPLPVLGRPCALLIAADPAEGYFTTEAVDRAALLTAHATTTLSSLEMFGRLRRRVQEAVETLAEAVNVRDPYTHRHSSRTRALVRAVGEALRLPAALIRVIEQGALLHDVGKVGIPDAILQKPGPLTPEEYAEMKKHPALGFAILQRLPPLRSAASVVLFHQEWYNGQGYPDGLAGEEIPVGARLVAVIDAWDAMTSNRPYRAAMPRTAAIAELRRQAGTQFDPKVVEAFLRVVERLEREGVATTETPSEVVYPGAPAL